MLTYLHLILNNIITYIYCKFKTLSLYSTKYFISLEIEPNSYKGQIFLLF